MNTEKLCALLKALEIGSIAAAAKELHYSQTGMQYAINSLEHEFGFPLLKRTSKGVLPTEQAERLLPELRELALQVEILNNSVTQIRRIRCNTIRIAAYPSITRAWCPQLLSDVKSEFPNMNFQIISGTSGELIEYQRNKELDIMLAGNLAVEDTKWTHLYDDEYMMILPQNYTGPYINGYPDLPYLAPAYAKNGDLLFRRVFLDDPYFETLLISSDIHDIISMVQHGLGFSVLTLLNLGNSQKDVKTLPLPVPCSREIGMIISNSITDPLILSVAAFLRKQIVAHWSRPLKSRDVPDFEQVDLTLHSDT